MIGVLIEYAKHSRYPHDQQRQQATSVIVFQYQPVNKHKEHTKTTLFYAKPQPQP